MDADLAAVFEADGEPSMVDPEIRKRWIEEAERRAEEMRNGKVRGEPVGEALARIRARSIQVRLRLGAAESAAFPRDFHEPSACKDGLNQETARKCVVRDRTEAEPR